MQNLFETAKKAQMVVQVEAVRLQKELEAYGLSTTLPSFLFSCELLHLPFPISFVERNLMAIVKVS